nr:MAG: hypothetical protein [Bacteriophage sp.]
MVIGGALFGGNANNGTNAGFGYLNANNRSSNSNANIGFRFYRGFNFIKYNCDHHDLTTQGLLALLVAGKKIRIKTVLVSN